jgi:hypothetical protein
MAAAVHSALEVRETYSKIIGLWATESPQINEVCHIWAYPDLNARAAVRAAVGKDPRWQEFLKASAGRRTALDRDAAGAAFATPIAVAMAVSLTGPSLAAGLAPVMKTGRATPGVL